MNRPPWLQGMTAPTLMLWFYALACAVTSALGPGFGEMSKRAEIASSVAFPLVMATWAMADARQRGRRLCYDYDSFVYFAWPVVIPVYLFQTRGLRAFLTLLWFAGIWLSAGLVAAAIFMLREFGGG